MTRSTFMIGVLVSALAIAMLLSSCSSAPKGESAASPAACPKPELGETPADCPWAGITRVLSAGSTLGSATPELLSRAAPEIAEQLRSDARNEALKKLWGESVNFDELAHAEIVDAKILSSLASIFGVTVQGQVAHAGMEHTYGYLFSNLKTAYGYKRARWVRATLEKGFGLPDGLLGPTPREGTLLTNTTAFFGKIAFRDPEDAKEAAELARAIQGAAPQIRSYPIDSLKIARLEETVQINGRKVILRTDFAPFPYPIEFEKNAVLLVYSIRDGGHSRIVTGFPVEASFMAHALDPQMLGPKQPVQLRYNAHLEGWGGQKHFGIRKVIR